MSKKIVTFGEIMLRLKTPGYERFSQAQEFMATYGGGEANVAVSLANYGMDAAFVSRIPKNEIGEAAKMSLRKYGVDTTKMIYGGDRLGIYFLEAGAVTRASKVVYDRANSAIAEAKPSDFNWDEIFEGADWFHWTGITPAISQGAADICLEAIKAANAKGITVSTDLNYRKNLWKYGKTANQVMPALVAGCDVVLGNEEDAEMVLGIKPDGVDVTGGHVTADAYKSVSSQIMKLYPRVKTVITTLRGSISASHNSWSGVIFDKDLNMYEAPTYQITDIVDRVGGGDSFMGGVIYGLLTYGEDYQSAVNFATAASCLKHTISGDYNLATVSEVEKLMGGDASGRVSR
jgi:2-dehydro-3-deoxygluconokinase